MTRLITSRLILPLLLAFTLFFFENDNNSVSDLDRFTVVDKSSVNSSESVILGIKIEGIQRLRKSKQDDREL